MSDIRNINIPFDDTTWSFNSSDIEINSGIAQLRLQNNPNQNFTENFDNSSGHETDDTLEFSGGKLQQINQRPANAVLYNNFEATGMKVSPEDINFGDGTKTGALGNNATVHDGILDISSGGYWEGNIDNLSSVGQQGCILVRKRFGYIGSAPTTQYLIQTSTNADSRVYLVHNNGFIQCYITAQNTSNIFSMTFSWTPTNATKFYEFAVNWNATTGQARLLIDGVTQDTDTGTGTMNAPTLFRIGAGTDQLGAIDQVLVYDTVQHTSNYTPNWSGIPDADFLEGYDTLPEMVYTGAGTLISLDELNYTLSGNLLLALQIGRSGAWTYWEGEWKTGDGTKNYMCSFVDFEANKASLDVEGEIYGQFRIYLPISYTQGYISELTASLTAQIYPTTNPTLEYIGSILSMSSLISFVETITASGSDLARFILKVNGTYVYYSAISSSWVTSDLSLPQTNSGSEITANASTLFTTNYIELGMLVILHSQDGTTTPTISNIALSYNFHAVTPADADLCTVFGYISDITDEPVEDVTITVQSKNVASYGDEKLVTTTTKTIDSDSDGYWSINLYKSAELTPVTQYIFTFTGIEFSLIGIKTIPDETDINYLLLEE